MLEHVETLYNEALKQLNAQPEPPAGKYTPIQATDEIISIFCMLHGGVEEAMPIVRTQFFRSYVDFNKPGKDGLKKVVKGLVETTKFLKGNEVADLERKRFEFIIKHTL